MFLPCDYAVMGIFDSIFIRMGASDDILQNKSTFMVEMLECKNIILNLGDRSLVILDEIGRGTGTTDGISLAYSILKYLIECELKPVLFSLPIFLLFQFWKMNTPRSSQFPYGIRRSL